MFVTTLLVALLSACVVLVPTISVGAHSDSRKSFRSENIHVEQKLVEAVLRSDGEETIHAHVVSAPETQSFHVRAGPSRYGNVGWAQYKQTNNKTGWATLEIHTNSSHDDELQMAVAGYLEGLLSGVAISQTAVNLGATKYCAEKSSGYCARLDAFLSANAKWASEMVDAAQGLSDDERAFWRQYDLITEQISGVMSGYAKLAEHTPTLPPLSTHVMQMLMYTCDIEALEQALGSAVKRKVTGSGSCTAAVKVIGDYEDVLFAHTTWVGYATMLRIYKHYDLPVQRSTHTQSEMVASRQVAFSSYPGFLQSNDDFYSMSSGLATMETSLGNYNQTLFTAIQPESALYYYRVIIANRLARTGAEWVKFFSMHNSGTYNNQWMVFDYNRFTPGSPPKDGAFTVLEQLPTYIHAEDMTQFLLTNRYWPSYNLPYFPSVFQLGGFPSMVKKYGSLFDYHLAPRARIFDRDHGKVKDMESLMSFMRYNDFQHDEFGRCQCKPPYSGMNAIAARADLNPANGTYPFPALGFRLEGATDCKITSSSMIGKLQAQAIMGPTRRQQPVFKWSTSGHARPLGHPDAFQFNFTLVSWEEV